MIQYIFHNFVNTIQANTTKYYKRSFEHICIDIRDRLNDILLPHTEFSESEWSGGGCIDDDDDCLLKTESVVNVWNGIYRYNVQQFHNNSKSEHNLYQNSNKC